MAQPLRLVLPQFEKSIMFAVVAVDFIQNATVP
jgi:hypothetical protein